MCCKSGSIVVGKLSMDIDISSPQDHSGEAATANTYIAPSAANTSNQLTKSFIQRCQNLTAHLSSLSPSCWTCLNSSIHTDLFWWVIDRFGWDISWSGCKNPKLSSGSERSGGVGQSGERYRGHICLSYRKSTFNSLDGLLLILILIILHIEQFSNIQAHCTFLSGSQLSLLSSKGTSIPHCPLSNSYFFAVLFPLREAWIENMKVGLGTNVSDKRECDGFGITRNVWSWPAVRRSKESAFNRSSPLKKN